MQIILCSSLIEDYDELEVVKSVPGIFRYHIKKLLPNATLESYLSMLDNETRSITSIHDNPELGIKYHCTGLHLSERFRMELSKKKLYEYKDSFEFISTSLHYTTLNQIKVVCNDYDYIWYGPIFNSISKKEYVPLKPYSDELFPPIKNCKTKIYGVGGIKSDNIKTIDSKLLAGVVVCGAVWLSNNRANSLKEILQLVY